jgi:4-oxalocrotonate tautomerase
MPRLRLMALAGIALESGLVFVARELVFVAREKGATTMPEITISMATGRTDEQKAGMMRDITQALVKNLGIDADAVVIQINEAPLAHKMKGGKTFVERMAKK